MTKGSTAEARGSTKDHYRCAPKVDESGPDNWYRLDVPTAGMLALDLGDLPADVDVDVHLLDANKRCIRRGDARVAKFVQPGRYWASVDTWVGSRTEARPGAYTLSVGLTSIDSLVAAGLSSPVATSALRVFDQAWKRGKTRRLEYAITDFSLHSSKKRQWIVDFKNGSLLWNLLVAHGEASSDPRDPGFATTFSDRNGSHQSSLGLMKTGELYVGTFGPSHRLDGLEPGINATVRKRAVVMHPWDGSRAEEVAKLGYVMPTWGCPAIDDRLADQVRKRMAGGALMWFWAQDTNLLKNSTYLR